MASKSYYIKKRTKLDMTKRVIKFDGLVVISDYIERLPSYFGLRLLGVATA